TPTMVRSTRCVCTRPRAQRPRIVQITCSARRSPRRPVTVGCAATRGRAAARSLNRGRPMSSRGLFIIAAFGLAACSTDDPDLENVPKANVDPSAFVLPDDLTPAERAAIVQKYDALDPTGIVPRGLLEDAILYFDVNKPLIPMQDYLVVVDLS